MKRSRFTEEEIIAVLREQEAGVPTAEVCRKHGVSSATVGDSERDFLAARKMQLRTIGVRTGRARRDCEALVEHVVDDILAAVEVILRADPRRRDSC